MKGFCVTDDIKTCNNVDLTMAGAEISLIVVFLRFSPHFLRFTLILVNMQIRSCVHLGMG